MPNNILQKLLPILRLTFEISARVLRGTLLGLGLLLFFGILATNFNGDAFVLFVDNYTSRYMDAPIERQEKNLAFLSYVIGAAIFIGLCIELYIAINFNNWRETLRSDQQFMQEKTA